MQPEDKLFLSLHYNTVPETQGTSRTKGTFNGQTSRDSEDAAKLAAFRAQQDSDV